ncbi:MAG: hypothetical protein GDA35_02980 [Hyphomonadaceae bacterium]|nr:hypothetical protein [Hyphomonadaceae bacterium]
MEVFICTAVAPNGDGNPGSAMLPVKVKATTPVIATSCPVGFTEILGSSLNVPTICHGPLGNLSGFAGVLTESATIPYVEGIVYALGGRLDMGQASPGPCPDDVAPVVLTIEPGLTPGGVGEGTDVEYIQVHNSSGDGMRFRGGTVNANYLVLTGNADGQPDMDEGHTGSIEYMVGVPREADSSDSGIEVRSVAPGVEPQSRSLISNFTLLAANNTTGQREKRFNPGKPLF